MMRLRSLTKGETENMVSSEQPQTLEYNAAEMSITKLEKRRRAND